MTTRIAIIGAGIMGTDHAKIFAEDIPGAEITAICDFSEDRAREVAAQYGGVAATDPLEVIARDDVDAVVIASPDHTHAPLTLACIAANKPVLCEKPLSPSLEECETVMQAEMAHGRRMVQLGFMRRFDPSYTEVKSALDAGTFGRALMMHNFHRNVDTPAADFTGAMAITNSAPHEFDVARFVLGTEYAAVSAYQPKRSDALVAPVIIVLETTDGQIVNVEINNNAAYGYDVRGELVGEKGSAFLNAPTPAIYNLDLKGFEPYAADWRKRFAEAYRLQNKDFIHFVQTGEYSEIASDAWDGYCSTAVANAGAQALTEGRRVEVEMMDKPAFYS